MKIKIKLKLALKLSYSLCELTLPFIERSGRARSNRKSIDSSEKFPNRDARIRRGGGEGAWTLSICDSVARSSALLILRSASFSFQGRATLSPSRATCSSDRFVSSSFRLANDARFVSLEEDPFPPRACNFGKSLIPSIPFYFFFHPTRATHQNGIPFLSVTTNAARFVSREKYKPVKVGEFYPSGSSSFTAY